MPEAPCGAPTRGGSPCRYPAALCPHEAHARHREGRVRRDPAPAPAPPATPLRAVRERDLRALGWWLIEQTLAGRVSPPEASAVNRMMHTLLQLGPDSEAGERALREVALRGLLMHGVPPRTPEEWNHAAELFDDEALAEFRRWAGAVDGAEDADANAERG